MDESYPADYDSTHISYLSDQNGVRNRFIARFDSVIAFVDTSTHYRTVVTSFPISNYSRNILEQDVNIKANKFTEIIFQNGKYKMYVAPLASAETLKPIDLTNTSYRDYTNFLEQKTQNELNEKEKKINLTPPIQDVKEIVNEPEPAKKDSATIDINNYAFENEQKVPDNNPSPVQLPANVNPSDTLKAPDFVLAKQQNYNTSYSVDYVVGQLDNSFLGRSYQKFSGGGGPLYLNPGLNALFKIGMSDLFEDYRITGGLRYPFIFSFDGMNNTEFFLSYEDRMKNLDKQLVLHRQSLPTVLGDNTLAKVQTHDARYILKYPFSEVAGLRGSVCYRNDRNVFLSNNDANLPKPTTYQNWASMDVQYVFDNTIKKGLNLFNGLRAKAFGEYYRQIDKKKTDFFVVGVDVRHYQKVHRDIIWANRFAASSSFGSKKLIYYMGGVDNWFMPKFDNTTNIATDQNYAYQTLATNMRGFFQNARNGNSFAVINSELRIPVFKYLSRNPIRSDFAQNFQFTLFTDVGTAWTGYSPYSDNNSLNTTIVGSSQTPLIITSNTQHNPIIGGYGWGIRSRIFGYFIRLDRAWGMQDGVVLKPITHISLSLDF